MRKMRRVSRRFETTVDIPYECTLGSFIKELYAADAELSVDAEEYLKGKQNTFTGDTTVRHYSEGNDLTLCKNVYAYREETEHEAQKRVERAKKAAETKQRNEESKRQRELKIYAELQKKYG